MKKLKISKTMLLLVATGIVVMVLGILGMSRSQQSGERTELNQRLTTTQSKLKQVQLEDVSTRAKELEKRLSQTASQLAAIQQVLPPPVTGVAISSAVVDAAQTSPGIKLTQIGLSSVASVSLEGVPCVLITLTAKAEGDIPSIVYFVAKLNSLFTTGVVNSVTITVPEKRTGDNLTADNQMAADIQLAVYSIK